MVTTALAVVVLAHGIGHLLFLLPALRVTDWAAQSSHSWLLTAPLGDPLTRGIAAVAWTTSMVLFVAGVAGFVTGQDWWRPITIVAASVSLVGIVVFWDGIAAGSALFALVFDVLVIVAVGLVQWPSAEAAGP